MSLHRVLYRLRVWHAEHERGARDGPEETAAAHRLLAGYLAKDIADVEAAIATQAARADVERLTRERDDGRNEIADVPAAIAALREFVADPNVRTGAPVAEWTEREARLRRAIEREARAVRADRDRLAAALAGVLAAARACVDAFDDIGVPRAECCARNEALRVVLAATPADLAAARDARVRAEAYADGVWAERARGDARALREAAERAGVKGASWARGAFRRALQMWLRAEAERIERGGR